MTARYTKTAPKKEGYFWILEPCGETIIAWFVPFGDDAHFSSPHDNPMFNWSDHTAIGCTRSVKEVTP